MSEKIDWDADRKRAIYSETIQMLLDKTDVAKTPEDARKISDCIASLSRYVMDLAVVSPRLNMERYGEVARQALTTAPAPATQPDTPAK